MNILEKILVNKRMEVEREKAKNPISLLEEKTKISKRDFYKALKEGKGIKLIAEIKKASPSKGLIRKDFNPSLLAKTAEDAGAGAVSVLTDEKFFKGSLKYLEQAARNISIPVLRKGFIIDRYQVIESRVYGADALLLLANALSEKQIQDFLELSHSYGMACLVEAHTDEELKKVLNTSARIIGINNRNLDTFKVNIETTEKLISAISRDRVVVSESGIQDRKDMVYLEGLGIDAALVGEALMKNLDIRNKIRELLGYV